MSESFTCGREEINIKIDETRNVTFKLKYFCVCCSETDGPLVNLINCSHTNFLNVFFGSQLLPHNKLVCLKCHSMLLKINKFKEDVKENLEGLQEHLLCESNLEKNLKLSVFKAECINIPPNSDGVETDDPAPATSNDIETVDIDKKNDERLKKLMNMQKALDVMSIVNKDNSLGLISSGIQSIVAHNFGSLHKAMADLKEKNKTSNTTRQHALEVKHQSDESSDAKRKSHTVVEYYDSNDDEEDPDANKLKKYKFIRKIEITKEQLMSERNMQLKSKSYLEHPFKCPKCIVSYRYAATLDTHNREHSAKTRDSIQCDICEKFFSKEYLLKYHSREHYIRYQCVVCLRRFPTIKDAVSHFRTIHRPRKYQHKCVICKYTSNNVKEYVNHIRCSHAQFYCKEYCGLKCALDLDFKLGKMTIRERKCLLCDKCFKGEDKMEKHLREHDLLDFGCCDEEYDVWLVNISKMCYRINRSAKKYKCSDCWMSYPTEALLGGHLLMHHVKKKLKYTSPRESSYFDFD